MTAEEVEKYLGKLVLLTIRYRLPDSGAKPAYSKYLAFGILSPDISDGCTVCIRGCGADSREYRHIADIIQIQEIALKGE